MTPGQTLGLRTPSYGSLQHLQQQQQLLLHQQHQYQHHNGAAGAAAGGLLLLQPGSAAAAAAAASNAVGAAAAGGGRKNGKMLLAAGRDKERFLPWICKMAGRRKVGMLLLAVISLVVFVSILAVFNKDEEIGEGPELQFLLKRKQSPLVSPSNGQDPKLALRVNTSTVTEVQRISYRQPEIKEPLPYFNLSMFPPRHPCQHFSLPPPPPPSSKRTGPRPCDVCYLPVDHAIAFTPSKPSDSPVLKYLNYYSEHNSPADQSNGGSLFGGHQSLQQRKDSFDIKESMTVHCGFFKGDKPGIGGEFDIDEEDLLDMEQCHGVVVASAIFGNYDVMQQPKNISEITKKHACFYMFVDEQTEAFLRNNSELDDNRKSGLWRVVVVHNLPYSDARRNGKVPKLLLHRLFPNARYSLWIDGKLELVVDPFQLLERFLWRKNATFAISRHYKRFDVFVEAEANKAAGKYDNATIDQQIDFYKNEGLTPYSEAKLPITSDVPEGCVIIREHIPITNLFTCLWFNEVDRFTSRDQLSFSTVRDKIMSKVNWGIEMFLDCERRNFVIQAYHRDVMLLKLEQVHVTPLPRLPDRPSRKILPGKAPDKPSKASAPPSPKKPPVRRGRDRKSGSKHHRPRAANGRDSNSL